MTRFVALSLVLASACGGSSSGDTPDAPDAPGDVAIDAAAPDAPGPDASSVEPAEWPMPDQNPTATRQTTVDGPTVGAGNHVVDIVTGQSIRTSVEPVLCGGNLFVSVNAVQGSHVTAFNASGTSVGEYTLTDDELAGMICSGTSLYVLGQGRITNSSQFTATLHALASDGSESWSFPFATASNRYRLGGTLDHGFLVVSDSAITKVSATGTMDWQRSYGASRIAGWVVAPDNSVRLAFANGVFIQQITSAGTDGWVYTDLTTPIATSSARLAVADDGRMIVAIIAAKNGGGWVGRKLMLDATGHEQWKTLLNNPTFNASERVVSLTLDGAASCAQIEDFDSSNLTFWAECHDAAGTSTHARYSVGGAQPVIDVRGRRYAAPSRQITEWAPDHTVAGTHAVTADYEWIIPDQTGSLLLVSLSKISRLTTN